MGISEPVTQQSQLDTNPASHFYSYENVEFLGFLPGSFGAIEVHGNYAYTNCPGGLCVIDVSNPRRPEQVSFVESLGLGHVSIEGDYLYTANSQRLLVVNIKDPQNPEITSAFDLERHLGYLTGDLDYPIEVSALDIHDRKYIHLSLRLPAPWVSNDYGVFIVDASDPHNLTPIGFWDIFPDKSESILGISITGDTATILFRGDVATWCHYCWKFGLLQYDISDPLNPQKLAEWNPPNDSYFYDAKGSSTQNDIFYVFTGSTYKVEIRSGRLISFDVSNPTKIDNLGYYSGSFYNYKLDVNENYAYLIGEGFDYSIWEPIQQINILSVFNHENIESLGYLIKISPHRVYDLSQKDGIIYLTEGNNGLIIFRYAVSATLPVDQGGGLSFESPSGLTYFLHVPEVAMNYPTDLYISPVFSKTSPSQNLQVGGAIEVTAYNNEIPAYSFPFNTPINLWIKYSDEMLDLVTDENLLTLRWWDGSKWVEAAETCNPISIYRRDIEDNSIWLPVCEVGRFGFFGPTETIHLPIITK
jgi:hypothetical protein